MSTPESFEAFLIECKTAEGDFDCDRTHRDLEEEFPSRSMMGRICHAVEIDPGYCDVIVKRWESLTPGNKATRTTS